MILSTIVAAHHDDRVLGDTQFIELVNKHAEVVVEHQKAITPITIGALAGKLGPRTHRKMHQRMIEVEIEWLFLRDATLHEGQTALLVFEIARLLHLHIKLLRKNRLAAFSLLAFMHMGVAVPLGQIVGVLEPHALVVGP